MSILRRKQDESSSEATVSSIPVPPADSALVIDLPEGQKLVLGKMEEGTVIEVATWRGTGRPDSRTNRLMLGVSFGGATSDAATSEKSEEQLTFLDKIQNKVFSVLKTFVVKMQKLTNKLLEGFLSLRAKRKSLSPKHKRGKEDSLQLSQSSDSELSEDFDVDAWLNSVRSKSRLSQLPSSRNEVQGSNGKSKGVTSKNPSKKKPLGTKSRKKR